MKGGARLVVRARARARQPALPVVRSARASACAASAALAAVALFAGAVRLLPWLFDPDVPWRVAEPFARTLAASALEAALVVGWPVGWALACARAVEDGQARVLQSLGESPGATLRRFAPHGAALAIALGGVALLAGGDASAPGRVVTELLAEGRASCASARAPTSYVVPFTGLTWLCEPGRAPRLVGVASSVSRGAWMTARSATVSDDLRAIELDGATLALAGEPAVRVRAHTMTVRGMSPWARASPLPAALRAVLLAASAWGAGLVAARRALGLGSAGAVSRAAALVLGAAGPLAALGLMRALDRAGAPVTAYVTVPAAAWAGAAAAGVLLARSARSLGLLRRVSARVSRPTRSLLSRAAALARRMPRC